MKSRFAAMLMLALGGCTTYPNSYTGLLPAQGPLVPDTTLNLTPSTTPTLESLVGLGVYVGAAYLVLDPFNPNWEIEEAVFPDHHYRLALKMKRFYAGGAGEARAVFHQRAKDLTRRNGFDGYQVLEYTESLGSSVLGSQRTSQGVIQLTRKPG